MSDTMTEGVIVSWLKKEGDAVKIGDVLAEVETDKATMDFESPADGVLLHIGVQAGSAVPINAVIAVIGQQGEDFQAQLGQEQQSQPAAAAAGGNEQPAQQSQAQPQQQPAAQMPAPQQGQPAPTPQAAAPVQQAAPQTAQPAQNGHGGGGDGRIKASPLAKKLALESGVPLNQLAGSGEQGRIVRRDVEGFMQSGGNAGQQQGAQAPAFVPAGQEGFEDVAVSQMRKTIARRLAESKFGAPHFYLTIEIDMDRAMKARTQINEFLGSKVSFNDLVIRAVASALKKHPKVNASWLGDRIRYYQHVNIGVAIAVEDGLVVPVVRFADAKSLSQISQEVKGYGEKARSKKLQPSDFEGNTFTISNLGMFGIEEFTAIINPPDACILAVGTIVEKPVVVDGEIKIGNRMKVTLSCDHRVVDGATGAQFLQTLKQFMEEPVTILA
jgi:pyruvate dehydrogenase E2 component (dihydrolipoamide acetyltransferase)